VLLAAALILAHAPGDALAKRYGTDEVGGVALESSELKRSVAPDIAAKSGIIVTSDGRALWARDATEQRSMASITKMMVALLVLERGDLDERVTVSKSAAGVPYALGLKAGEQRSTRELLELALVASSNDAAYALAEHYGGTVRDFADLMNERADELGLDDTRFANPHGLDAKGHHSSAADLAVLAQTVMREREYRRIVAMKSVVLPAYKKRAARTYKSTNHLLGKYKGMLGGKTGFTDNAGYSFVSSAERDGITLTTVVLGTRGDAARFKNTDRLLDWGFKHLRLQQVATATETVGAVPLAPNHARVVPARFAETTSAVIFDLDGPVARSLTLPDTIALPVYEGQVIGHARLQQGERVVTDIPIVAAADMASAAETVGAVPVADYLERTVVARAADTSVPVPAFAADKPVERTVTLAEKVAAPVASVARCIAPR